MRQKSALRGGESVERREAASSGNERRGRFERRCTRENGRLAGEEWAGHLVLELGSGSLHPVFDRLLHGVRGERSLDAAGDLGLDAFESLFLYALVFGGAPLGAEGSGVRRREERRRSVQQAPAVRYERASVGQRAPNH